MYNKQVDDDDDDDDDDVHTALLYLRNGLVIAFKFGV